MSTHAITHKLPFELGEPRSFHGLTLVPLFPAHPPVVGYIGLDEAVAHGLKVSEIGAEGVVEWLLVESALAESPMVNRAASTSSRNQGDSVSRRLCIWPRWQGFTAISGGRAST
jgi:hypothetical protein